MRRKRWADLSPMQKFATILLGVVQLALLALALWDLRSRSAEEIQGSKGLWTALVFINYIGPVAYFLIGRKASGREPRYIQL